MVLLAAFLWLFRRTEYAGADQLAGGENLLFRLDPLAGAAAMLAARQFIAAFWPAAVIVALTLLFGRFFCGWICPLGTFLDIFHRLLRPIARRTNRWLASCFSNNRRLTASGSATRFVLLVTVLLAAAFAFPLVGFVDPFSLLVRGMTFCIDPWFYRAADAGFGWAGQGWTADVLKPFAQKHLLPFRAMVFHTAAVSAALLGLIFLLEFAARRFWCRYLCPAGAMFSLLGQWTPFLKRSPVNVCKTCGHCAETCRIGALDPAAGFSPSRCTLCMDCIDDCPKGIVQFGFFPAKKSAKTVPQPVDLSRRSALVGIALGAAIPSVAAAAHMLRPRSPDPFLIRPPGAADDEKKFLNLCIRCGECLKVCPTNVLQPAVLEAGVKGVFSPRLLPRFIFEQSFCEYSCTLCGQVCPTGAIPRLTEEAKHAKPTGHAYFDHSRCLPWAENTPCIRCEEMCPAPDKAIKILKTVKTKDKNGQEIELQFPYVDRDLCVGCGICESNCTIPGVSAVRVRRLDSPDPGTEFLLKGATPKEGTADKRG